jgi:hypothetical protein
LERDFFLPPGVRQNRIFRNCIIEVLFQFIV